MVANVRKAYGDTRYPAHSKSVDGSEYSIVANAKGVIVNVRPL
jgi:hypothetical protein